MDKKKKIVKKEVREVKVPDKTDYKNLAYAFSEASKLTGSLVVIPILFLIIGVFLDKLLNSKPLFVVISIATGVVVGFLRAVAVGKKFKNKSWQNQNNKRIL